LPRSVISQSSSRATRAPESEGDEQEALPRAIIDYHQDAEAAPVDELIRQEVERPALIGKLR
jgi:hypothetical protein